MVYTGGMTTFTRKRISLFLCLWLTAFLFCQGMAKAALLLAMPQPVAAVEKMNCPMMQDGHAVVKADSDMGCQHLDKAYSADLPSMLGDHMPLIVLFLIPSLMGDAGSPIRLASLPWHDPPSNISLPIRLQRFLK